MPKTGNGTPTTWQEIVQRKREFIGGEVRIAEKFGGVTYYNYAPIIDILLAHGEFIVVVEWQGVRKQGNRVWYKNPDPSDLTVGGQTTFLQNPTDREDGCVQFEIPLLGDVVLSPTGHARNLNLSYEDMKTGFIS